MNDSLVTIPGYQIIEQIYAGGRTLVYRGLRDSDQKLVVIKLLRNQAPNFSELVQFRHQYIIAKNLNIPGIIKPTALLDYGHSYALVMEDFRGISLKEYIASYRLKLSQFFLIAIQLVIVLEDLYSHRIIHKDLKPANILINPITLEVKLIDFSISTLLPKETQTLNLSHLLEGTLAYISPEQTGRMNRGIDYRTDFYSLGIIYFELLTGQLPFTSYDPLELIHCHIAQQPPTAHSINPEIPPILSEIINKLMAKNVEDRYQSSLGLKHDLERCWQQWLKQGKIESFPLGNRDISDRFTISEKLYGREAEVATLLATFNRVSGKIYSGSESTETGVVSPLSLSYPRSEMMLVSGFSGIGKTAVVNEVHKPIVRQRGYFIKGKFDQLQRNIPLSGFLQAFRDLMGQLLSESDEKIAHWQDKILSALGENGQLVIELVPELESIIGKQLPVPELSGSAAQNRFNLLFKKFIQVFTTQEHPLVIFLDDLQWADAASLKLIQLLMEDVESGYLLLIGSYRYREVSAAHPLMLTLNAIRETAATVNTITLAPLKQADLNHLIADTLHCTPQLAWPLTQLVYQKTKGNPFFSTQFLKALYEERSIQFNFEFGYWQCDIAQVRALSLTDDIVEFMALQLQKLPKSTQDALKLAACLGNSFDLETLAVVQEQPPTETAAALWPALQEGLVMPTSEIYKFYQEPLADKVQALTDSADRAVVYKFLHDRVQQAAYFLIPENQKPLTHLKIGQLLLSKTVAAEREEKIFEIVNQLNDGMELLADPAERYELAQLNLMAGRKAKIATAYAAVAGYLATGRTLLALDSWQTHYDLTLALYVEGAEAAYLTANFEQMEELAAIVSRNAKILLDQVKVYEVQLSACTAQVKPKQAVEMGIEVLKLLGVNFPEQPSPADIQEKLEATAQLFTDNPIGNLIDLPEMVEPNQQAALRILSGLVSPAYITAPAFLPLIILEMVQLSVQYGNAPLSAFAYGLYGLILSGVLQEIETGYEFGKLALNLVDRLNANSLKTKIFYTVAAHLLHGKHHLKESLPLLHEGYERGLETGELELGYSAKEISQFSYFIGLELQELVQDVANYSKALAHLRQETALNYNQIIHQTLLNLLGCSDHPCCFLGEAYNEKKMLPLHREANDRNGLHYFHFHKMILCYIFGDVNQALENAGKAEQCLDAVTGMLNVPFFYFYDSLIRLAAYQSATESEREEYLGKVHSNQEKVQKWAHHASMNFLHKFYLVAAEEYRVLGQNLEAMDAYEKAIQEAKKNEYVNEEALASELAGKFYLAWGKEIIAQTYLTHAYYCYARWGAKAKIEDLEKRYPQLLAPLRAMNQISLNSQETGCRMSLGKVTNSSSSTSQALDLASVLKASQAMSGEIILEQLLATVMRIVIENAGASKGVLILQQAGRLVVAASVSSPAKVAVLPFIPVASSSEIPVTVINYVDRTGETLAIDDANRQTAFAADPYLAEYQPKSILCLPLRNQGKRIGLVYLENRLTVGAFTRDRLEILSLLCFQAAISLENALLYDNLERANQQLEEYSNTLEAKVKERTLELKAAQKQMIAQEKLASLGTLTAGVAHELRNPLNFVNNYAESSVELTEELLQEIKNQATHLDTDTVGYFQAILVDIRDNAAAIHQHGARAERIIGSMMQHARTETSNRQLVDLNTLLEQAVQLAYHSHRAKNSAFNTTISTDYDRSISQLEVVSGDLNRAFINIIDNACYAVETKEKFAQAQPANEEKVFSPTLWIKTKNLGQSVEIRIRDNGIGIPPELTEKIFEPFFTTKSTGEGTGLGLSLTHDIIVGQHRGTLNVESEVGAYTEFIITLPMALSA